MFKTCPQCMTTYMLPYDSEKTTCDPCGGVELVTNKPSDFGWSECDPTEE